MARLQIFSSIHHLQICTSAVLGWFQRATSQEIGIPKTPFSVQLWWSLMWLVPAAMKLFIFGSSTVGYEVREKYNVDMALPFGLQSEPFIFIAIADMVQWMLHFDHIDNFLCHYLDSLLCRHSLGSSWNLSYPLNICWSQGNIPCPLVCLSHDHSCRLSSTISWRSLKN